MQSFEVPDITKQLIDESWRRGDLQSFMRPTQAEIGNWWEKHDAVLSVVHARRGFGKTMFMLIKAFEHMAKHPNSRQVYAAPTREEAKKIVVPSAHLLIPDHLPDNIKPKWYASEHAFFHPNGAMLVVEGADDDQGAHLRGPFADRVYMDEHGFWRFANHVWRAVLFPMIERRNGRALGVSTSPESPMHEFATIIIPESQLENAYVKVTIEDDYTLTQERRDKIASQYSRTRDPADGRKSTIYRREYGCELVTETERAVLPEFNFDLHVADRERPEYFECYVVMDQGFVDLTHCLFIIYDWKNATVLIEDEVCVHHVTVSELAPMILAKEKELWGDHKIRKRVSDSPPISLAEFARQHQLQPDKVPREIRFAAVENREPEALINRTRSLLAVNRIAVNPRCVELIKQARGGLYNARRTDFERIPGLGHLDGIMALAYAVDTVDYATDPELMQKKWNQDDYPTHWQKKPETAQNQSLARLLPKIGRRPVKDKTKHKVRFT